MSKSQIATGGIADDAVTADKTFGVARPNAKPLIINGNMKIAQRGTSTADVGGSNIFASCDRWKLAKEGSPSARFTQSQDTDVPTGEGFTSSLKMDCTTAAGSPDADDAIVIQQKIEAQDLQLLKYGTSNAEKVTLSFWVKATKTGTNVVWIYQNDDNRSQAQSYTVDSTNTWEKKVLVFNADTTGVIDNNSGEGFRISWWLTAGTNFTSGTLSTAWESHTAANNAVGQVNNADSTSNNWYLTGVQLEVGEFSSTTLPPFQFESFAENLARCHRYCYVMGSADNAENGGQFTVGSGLVRSSGSARFTDIVGSYPQPFRALPSVTQVGGDLADLFCYKNDGTSADPTSISIGRNTIALRLTNNMGTSSGLTAGDATVQQIVEDDTDLVFEAEL